jgi:hypothetical protein
MNSQNTTNHPEEDDIWTVVSDPLTCSSGLLPPSGRFIQNAVEIEEAISFTTEARLVTQSTPPFLVVHVNRAFLLMAGLNAKESLIGRPVESIVKVIGEVPTTATATTTTPTTATTPCSNTLRGVIFSPDNLTACRIRALPVVDRSRRQRISTDVHSCMSHVLIQVEPDTTVRAPCPQQESVQSLQTVVQPCSSATRNVVGAVG